jgi:tRNA (mo5U34)-methyltransferase
LEKPVDKSIGVYRSLRTDELLRKISSLPWFHSIDLGNGIITPGRATSQELHGLANVIFDRPMTQKTVLDIGCYDGFFSYEALRRGAKRVLATDFFMWQYDPRCRETFELARAYAAPDLEDRIIDIPDLTPASVGQFDVVLFSGIFYHLRNPFLTLEGVAKLATDTLVVETHLDAMDIDRPAMILYPTTELNNDPTNWWGPNPACVMAMLRDLGFSRVDYQPNPNQPTARGVFHARR